MRRSSISAVKSTQATLASSEGWMPSAEEHCQEQQADEGQQPRDHQVAAVGAVVDAHHDRQDCEPQNRPQALLDQEQIGLVEPLQGDQRRGAEHHHHAHADQ
jgi:hypothetical protein